jgi:peptidoglycan hydrolase CwlO-like protein
MVAVVPAQQTKNKSARSKTTAISKTKKKKKTSKTSKRSKTTKKTSTVTVNSLKNEQAQVRQQIKEQERRLRANERDVKKRLQNLMVINNEIADRRRTIDTIRGDIHRLDGNIHVLQAQLKVLERELEERKQRFQKSMRYMHRNRSIQNQMMFIFSAKNFSQMYRRLRFVREYAAYQKAQGEAVETMQAQVAEALEEL